MRPLKRLIFIPVITLLTSCAAYSVMNSDRYYDSPSSVPERYVPAMGQCRIWYPERPASQQTPWGNCDELQHQLPADAVLIRS